MEYVAIFEGGGAKGLAHIGALKATEEKNIIFKSIGGTSAGAIIASLIASGYTADELYTPNSDVASVFSINLLELLDKETWKSYEEIKKTIEEIKNTKWLKTKLFFAYRKHKKDFKKLKDNYGLFDTSLFIKWLEKSLRIKLNLNRSVLFKDLKTPLTIIATDVSGCNIKTYNSHSTPNEKVSEAVSASISIPIFFEPTTEKDKTAHLVDGGIVSNYPTWIFDSEREDREGRLITLGYKLVEKETEGESKKDNFFHYVIGILNAALWGDQELEIRGIENLHSIPLKVSTGTFDFDLDKEKKDILYNEGKDSTNLYFNQNIGLGHQKEVSDTLEILTKAAKLIIEEELNGNAKLKHLRSNVFIPTFQNSERLRLVYNFGMENDTDDCFLIKKDSGAAGICYGKKRAIICDLVEAAKTYKDQWKLNKYQQALVRKTLKSLISIPIFEPSKNNVIAVLSFDSDDDILNELEIVRLKLEKLSPLLYKAMIDPYHNEQ